MVFTLFRHSKQHHQRATRQLITCNSLRRQDPVIYNFSKVFQIYGKSFTSSSTSTGVSEAASNGSKYRLDVVSKDNMRVTTERIREQPIIRYSSLNRLRSSFPLKQLTGPVHKVNDGAAVLIDLTCGENIWKELERLLIAAVMNKGDGLASHQFLSFVTCLQKNAGGVSLSAQQIVHCSEFLSKLSVSPSSAVKRSVSLITPFRDVSDLAPSIISSLSHFLAGQMKLLDEKNQRGMWSFEHTSSVLFNMRQVYNGIPSHSTRLTAGSVHPHRRSGGGTEDASGVEEMINTLMLLQSQAREPISGSVHEPVTLRQISRMAAGVALMPANYPATGAVLQLLAYKLDSVVTQSAESPPSIHSPSLTEGCGSQLKSLSVPPSAAAQARDMMSLFDVLKHHQIAGVKNSKSKELKGYIKGLANVLKSDTFLSSSVTLEGVYMGVVGSLGGFHGRSSEEVLLINAVQRVVLQQQSSSSSSLSTPSLSASCQALAGLRGLSSADAAVRSLLSSVSKSIASSQTALSVDMLTGALKGLRFKNTNCPEVYGLIGVLNSKLQCSQSRALLTDSLLSHSSGRRSPSGSVDRSSLFLRSEPLEALFESLSSMKTDRSEVKKLFSLLAPQVEACVHHFLQGNRRAHHRSGGDELGSFLSGAGRTPSTGGTQAFDEEVILTGVRNNMNMMSLLYQGLAGCRHFSAKSHEAMAMVGALSDGIRNLQREVSSQKDFCRDRVISLSHHQSSDSGGGDGEDKISAAAMHLENVGKVASMNPVIIMKAFDVLSNMKGGSARTTAVLSMLTNSLEEALSRPVAIDSNTPLPSHSDVYRVLWAVRGLYPGNTSKSPEMNHLAKTLLQVLQSSETKSKSLNVFRSTTIHPSPKELWQAVYCFQNLNPDNAEVRGVLAVLASDIQHALSRGISQAKSLKSGRNVNGPQTPLQNMLFGLRNMKSTHREVKKLLKSITSVLAVSTEVWNAKYAASTLSSLQYMNSDCEEVRAFVGTMCRKLGESTGLVPRHQLNKCIDSLRGMCSDEPEVRLLLSTLARKTDSNRTTVTVTNAELGVSLVPPSFVGFQRMSSQHAEVRLLLDLFTSSVLSSPLTAAAEGTHRYTNNKRATSRDRIGEGGGVDGSLARKKCANSILGTLHGLRGLSSEHAEVRRAISSLLTLLASRGPLNDSGSDPGPGPYPYVGFVASAVYGLQCMSSQHEEVKELVSYIAEQATQCSVAPRRAVSKTLSAREIGMMLIGLQRLNSECGEVRSLLRSLLPLIHRGGQGGGGRESGRHLLGDNLLGWYVESCIGLQNMCSDHVEVSQLVQAVTAKIKQSAGDLSTTAIAKAFIGMSNLRSVSNLLESPQTASPSRMQFGESIVGSALPSPHSREVNDLISVLTGKIKASNLFTNRSDISFLQFESKNRNTVESNVINGEFVCAAFFGLKNRSSAVPEVRELMSVVLSMLKLCPVGLTADEGSCGEEGDVLGDSRRRRNGLTSYQLSSCFASLNSCHLEHDETVDLMDALLPHLEHIIDLNIKKAVGSITDHFSQTTDDRDRYSPQSYDIDPDEIFTGRHFSNILFGLHNMDIEGVSADRAQKTVSQWCSLLRDVVHANCNTTLSERVNRGVTISIMDSNNSVWSGEDASVAMGALRYCHVRPHRTDERRDDVLFSDVLFDESDDCDHDHLDLFRDVDEDEDGGLNLDSFVYDVVGTLADCLHNMQLNTRRNNSDGTDLIDFNEDGRGDFHGVTTGCRGDERGGSSSGLQRVISVPHLARAAFGLRHLSADDEAVQRALEAIVHRLQDNYANYSFPGREGASSPLLSDEEELFLWPQSSSQPAACHATSTPTSPPATSCSAEDLSLLLRSVGKMTVRYTAVGKLYSTVANLIHNPQSAQLDADAGAYHPAVGYLSFKEIAEVFYCLRFNQCSSEVRNVVASLSAQLCHLNAEELVLGAVEGSDVSKVLTGMSSMTSQREEVCSVLGAVLDHLHRREQECEGGVAMSAGDICTSLASMSHMSVASPQVQDMLVYFCGVIERGGPGFGTEGMVFSVSEMHAALEGLSGLSIGAGSVAEREVVETLVNLIRTRVVH